MGDHVRLVMLEAIMREIQEKNLLKLVRESGDILLNGLKELGVRVINMIYVPTGGSFHY